MLGVGAGADSLHAMQLAGIAGLVAGALSMAAGECMDLARGLTVQRVLTVQLTTAGVCAAHATPRSTVNTAGVMCYATLHF